MRVRRSIVIAAVAALIAAFVGGTAFAGQFVDVTGGPHADNVDAIVAAGITAGCTDPQSYCPNASVTRAQMASFLARGLGLSSGATKNFPKANSRSDFESYCAAVKLSPKSFPVAPCLAQESVIEEVTGGSPSTTVNIDGLAITSYFDQTNGDLKFARCANASCSTTLVRVIANPSGKSVGNYSSIAVNASGLPVMSYYDATATDLWFAYCTDPNCGSSIQTAVADASEFDFGKFSSLGLGGDNNPVIAFLDSTNGVIRLSHCQSAACVVGGGASIDQHIIAPVGPNTAPSLAIGNDGFPVVAFQSGGSVKLIHCQSFTCNARSTVTLDASGLATGTARVVTGTDGFPMVLYAADGALKATHCTAIDCSTSETTTIVPKFTDQVLGSSSNASLADLAVGVNGNPVFAYVYVSPGGFTASLTTARCLDRKCSAVTQTASRFGGGAGASLVIGPSGHALTVLYENSIGTTSLRAWRENPS